MSSAEAMDSMSTCSAQYSISLFVVSYREDVTQHTKEDDLKSVQAMEKVAKDILKRKRGALNKAHDALNVVDELSNHWTEKASSNSKKPYAKFAAK
jgi:hypothetical protein